MEDNVQVLRIDGMSFRKSSFSEGGGDCVEAAKIEGIAVRDSKHPDGPALWFTLQEWAAFVLGVMAGEFDFN